MLESFMNGFGDLHIVIQIISALIFLPLAGWAIWSLLKMFLNIFGITKKEESKLELNDN
jgi:hypothetical protein